MRDFLIGNEDTKMASANAITLECTVCGNHNYRTTKNKKNTPDRLEINKFCPKCGKKTPHKEGK